MVGDAAQGEIARLRAEIARHNRLYYEAAAPEIEDEAYDALVRRLQALEACRPDLAASDSPTVLVGGAPDARFPSAAHSRAMISLQNSYDPDDVTVFDERVRRELCVPRLVYTVEPKIDGVAVALRYEAGELALALTRGDGRHGDVVTANLRTLPEIPARLRADWRDAFPAGAPLAFEVRGEVFLTLARFRDLNAEREAAGLAPFANPRNATAGTLKTLDAEEVRHRRLNARCYQLFPLDDAPEPSTHEAEIAAIRRLGLPAQDFLETAADAAELAASLARLAALRESLGYQIDGAVIKVNERRWQAALGETAKAPRWGIAYKYAAATARSRVEDIVLQVGRTGVITPVAVLTPVALAGTTIARATLHNWEEVARKDVRIGDTVIVAKGGDVIPKIVSVVVEARTGAERPLPPPRRCPICRTTAVQREAEVAWRCPNGFCPAVAAGRLRHFAGRDACDIAGLGEHGIDQLLETKLVRGPADLLRLRHDQLAPLPGWGELSAASLVAAVALAKDRPWAAKIFALGIPSVGAATALTLARRFPNIDALRAATREDLAELRDIGKGKGEKGVASEIVAFFASPGGAALVEDLRAAGFWKSEEAVPAAPPPGATPLAGRTYVLTGTLAALSRAEAKRALEALGAKVTGSVSRKTAAVVAGADPGSKLADATRLGVPVLDEAALRRLLAGEDVGDGD